MVNKPQNFKRRIIVKNTITSYLKQQSLVVCMIYNVCVVPVTCKDASVWKLNDVQICVHGSLRMITRMDVWISDRSANNMACISLARSFLSLAASMKPHLLLGILEV